MRHYACSSVAQEEMFLGGRSLEFGRMSANVGGPPQAQDEHWIP